MVCQVHGKGGVTAGIPAHVWRNLLSPNQLQFIVHGLKGR